MENIADNREYLSRMTKTFIDKAFFLKYIPENIDTIVDYGCSDGSFLDFIRNICGNRYNYIGIEPNKDFRILAEDRGFIIHNDDSKILELDNETQRKTCICMSSVIHEICSYNGESSSINLLNGLSTSNFGTVAIRDMSISFKDDFNTRNVSEGMIEFLNQAIINYKDQFHDFVEKYGIHSVKDMFHFLLKYMYVKNWNRELNERYVWKSNSLDNYKTNVFTEKRGWTTIGEKFQIPYLEEKWERDFNPNHNRSLSELLENTYTHFKAVFTRS